MVYCLIFILQAYTSEPPKKGRGRSKKIEPSRQLNFIGLGFMCCMSLMLFLKKSPLQYYFYVAFPVYFWTESIKGRNIILSRIQVLSKYRGIFVNLALYILGLEVLVYSYFQREVLSVCLVVSGILWPLLMEPAFRKRNSGLACYWLVSCLFTSVFTLLPVEKGEQILQVYDILMFCLCI